MMKPLTSNQWVGVWIPDWTTCAVPLCYPVPRKYSESTTTTPQKGSLKNWTYIKLSLHNLKYLMHYCHVRSLRNNGGRPAKALLEDKHLGNGTIVNSTSVVDKALLTNCVKEMYFKNAWRTNSTIIFRHSTKHITVFWGCCSRRLCIKRGFYTVAQRYEFYFEAAKQYFTNERSEWVKYCFVFFFFCIT